MGPNRSYNTVVIGGGASGLAAALTAARHGQRVCILEKDVACGLKILATGNGRCNLSNAKLSADRYLHPDIAAKILGEEPERELDGFFASLGILTTREEDRLYPYSMRAESVRDALLDACRRAKVGFILGATVTAADRNADGTWTLSVSHPARELKCKPQRDQKAALRAKRRTLAEVPRADIAISTARVIIAVGDGIGDAAPVFSLPAAPSSPVLCPVAAIVPGAKDALDVLNGLRTRARVSLYRDGAPLWTETGEVLFRPFGISGVVVFNLSRRTRPGDTVRLDFFPELDARDLHHLLEKRIEVMGPYSTGDPTWFDGLIAPALARVVCAVCERCHPGTHDVIHLAHILKGLKLDITGLAEDQPAQVTRGGIPLDAIDPATLACTDPDRTGLSVCGEALDIDADCGGFNLAWAWLTGIRAASAVQSTL